jgi:hypothetical protein
MRHDNNFDPAHMREIIYDLFAGSFEEDCGCVPEIVDSLSTAIFEYRCATEDALDVDAEFINSPQTAEKYFCDCLRKIFVDNGWNSNYLDDYAAWPDNLSIETNWEKQVLRELALIQAGHDLVVRDQLQKLWKEEEAKKTAQAAAQKAE